MASLARQLAALALVVGAGTACKVDADSPGGPPSNAQRGPPARLLFKSGFEGAVMLGTPVFNGSGAWQDITGTDAETGFSWPPRIWGGGTSRLQLIAGAGEKVRGAASLSEYMYNEIQTVAGRDGRPTRALYSAVLKSTGGAIRNTDATQNVFHLLPGPFGQGDLYVRYWLKLQPDLLERMTTDEWAARVVSDWKTGLGSGGSPGADYRIVLSIFADRAGNRLYWHIRGDNVANGGLRPQIFWELTNTAQPVPVGEWFSVETFVHRSGDADGRAWVAINRRTLFDRHGPNLGVNGLPWNRIMIFLNYSTGQILPAYQWVDDVEIWDGFAPGAAPH